MLHLLTSLTSVLASSTRNKQARVRLATRISSALLFFAMAVVASEVASAYEPPPKAARKANRKPGARRQAKNAGRQASKAPTASKNYQKRSFTTKEGKSIDYWVMPPANVEKGKKYPLVLTLHGRGGNTTAANVLGSEQLRDRYPCYVIAPSSTREGHWASPPAYVRRGSNTMLPAALEAMEAFIESNPVDTSRIYVTGQSMGGVGTFGAVMQRPKLFAAAVPVCGGWDAKQAEPMKETPMWVFHGDKDKTVPTQRSRDMVKAIKAAGGEPKYTEYEGVGHNSWTRTYSSPETWKWMFAQRRAPSQ